MREPIIAIDGPSGAGKSTLSRLLAERLGFTHIDTGAMYRCVALAVERNGIDVADLDQLARLCDGLTIAFQRDATGQKVLLNGEDVSEAIRQPHISLLTSQVAAVAAVREAMVTLQRQMGRAGGVVLEGRDIGSVVFPDAEVKFYLSASARERGRRRYEELCLSGQKVDLEQTIGEIEARDVADQGREHSPLMQPEDAVLIDSTGLTIEQVLAKMVTVVEARRLAGAAG
ncbi:MAG: (d)CMP kinase [Desulfuromonas sp.]|nr:MAG: (d)CMP kinase [Desulfuromonas sp.]